MPVHIKIASIFVDDQEKALRFYTDMMGFQKKTDKPIRDTAHAADEKLRSEGALIGIAGTPVQMRNADAKNIETCEGSFMSSTLPVAGFTVMADAIKQVSQIPCAVAHGVVEVWPLT